MRLAIAEGGLSSIFQGLSASILRQMTYSMVRIGAYETIKARMTNGKKPSTTQLIISGAFAGGLGGVAGNPADIVLVRMTTDARLPPEKQRNYRNAIDGVIRIVRDEGASALMRGVGPNTARAMLMTSSQMATYDVTKNYLMMTSHPKIRLKDGLALHIVASGVAGLVATTICSPADVIKSRIMAKENGSLTQLIRKSLRNEGPQFLFKGWTPSFMRLAPNTILLFVILEQLKGLYRGVLTVAPS
ncbi:Mitochondrial dicarboxylate transporter [Tulasnella sp. 332]|nr:Mitochondrial dicarboxylate transporter [Tulasnella sp. 332]